jgi:hypothetical protein
MTPPPRPPRPTAAGLPECGSGQVRLGPLSLDGLTGGTVAGGIVVTDVGSGPCFVRGRPTVTFFDVNGREVRPGGNDGLDGWFYQGRPDAKVALTPAGNSGWQAMLPVSLSPIDVRTRDSRCHTA